MTKAKTLTHDIATPCLCHWSLLGYHDFGSCAFTFASYIMRLMRLSRRQEVRAHKAFNYL